jgi:tetratricopeptide (TPR) repeat protein
MRSIIKYHGTLVRLGNYTGAIEYIDKALTIQPNNSYALIGKGTALGQLGNFTGAILYYDKALAIQPNNSYALDNKAAALDNHTIPIEYIDKALRHHEVIKSFPGDNIYLHAGHYNE